MSEWDGTEGLVQRVECAHGLKRIMSTKRSYRGHPIAERSDGTWVYLSDGVPVPDDRNRACGHCLLPNRPDGHDACLGDLPGAMNACCGHGGGGDSAYVQLRNGLSIGGFENLRGGEDAPRAIIALCTDLAAIVPLRTEVNDLRKTLRRVRSRIREAESEISAVALDPGVRIQERGETDR